MRRLKIFTWPIHGSYFNNLAQIDTDWYIPVAPERANGYGGKGHTFDLPKTVFEVPAAQVRDLDFDIILYQHPQHYAEDRFDLFSEAQRNKSQIYLEHNTPRPHPTDSQHPVDDPNVLLVHVTHFNQLMWDDRRTPSVVIEHAVAFDPQATYTGTLERGITVCNCIQRRPRIAGYDLFLQAREHVPLDAAGIETERFGGLGDIPYRDLHRRMAPYRFLFSPMRYTSLPLAVVEAMTLGMPIVALATTELPTVIVDGEHGFLSCDPSVLVDRMRFLLANPMEAHRMGANARNLVRERFSMERFVADWNAAFVRVLG